MSRQILISIENVPNYLKFFVNLSFVPDLTIYRYCIFVLLKPHSNPIIHLRSLVISISTIHTEMHNRKTLWVDSFATLATPQPVMSQQVFSTPCQRQDTCRDITG